MKIYHESMLNIADLHDMKRKKPTKWTLIVLIHFKLKCHHQVLKRNHLLICTKDTSLCRSKQLLIKKDLNICVMNSKLSWWTDLNKSGILSQYRHPPNENKVYLTDRHYLILRVTMVLTIQKNSANQLVSKFMMPRIWQVSKIFVKIC